MKQAATFTGFFAGMDWDMLTDQRSHLCAVRAKKSTTATQKVVLDRIIALVDLWIEYKIERSKLNKFNADYNRKLIDRLLEKMNWKQLKADKTAFIMIGSKKSLTAKQDEALEGILNGIDAWQDAAVDSLGIPEHEIFTLSQE